jgi:hypothetical protein
MLITIREHGRPEDGRSYHYNNQKRRPRNYEGYCSHSQVAAGYRDNNNNNQGEKRRSSGYRNDSRDDSGPSKPFRQRTSRDYNQSPEDILNGPCHMHYTYIDGKRVLNHLMKDCLHIYQATRSRWIKASGGMESGICRNPWISNVRHTTAPSVASQQSCANPRIAEPK